MAGYAFKRRQQITNPQLQMADPKHCAKDEFHVNSEERRVHDVSIVRRTVYGLKIMRRARFEQRQKEINWSANVTDG